MVFLAFVVSQGLCYSFAENIFCVKPADSVSGCSANSQCSEDFPCHFLKHYVSHSNFTNNSIFYFLEGEHRLDSVVSIVNVANLSLLGIGVRVTILCNSLPSGIMSNIFVG